MRNDRFYNKLPSGELESVALKTFGGNPSSDFEQIKPYLEEGRCVLEIGCGSGRIGLEIVRIGLEYTGIEKQKRFLDVFKNKIHEANFSYDKITLLNIDFRDFITEKNFSVILFSWTVIGDFTKREQKQMLEKTFNILEDDGVCILDNPSKDQKYNHAEFYEPTPFYYDDWKEVLDTIGFIHKAILYKTKTGIERELTILSV